MVGQTRYRSCQKYEYVSLRDLPTGRHLLGVLFITSLKSSLCTALTVHNTTNNNCTNSHAQNTTAFQPTLVSGHKQGAVGFLQRKQPPRPTENSSVSVSICCLVDGEKTKEGSKKKYWVQPYFNRGSEQGCFIAARQLE